MKALMQKPVAAKTRQGRRAHDLRHRYRYGGNRPHAGPAAALGDKAGRRILAESEMADFLQSRDQAAFWPSALR
jgi:hypothetical protein